MNIMTSPIGRCVQTAEFIAFWVKAGFISTKKAKKSITFASSKFIYGFNHSNKTKIFCDYNRDIVLVYCQFALFGGIV